MVERKKGVLWMGEWLAEGKVECKVCIAYVPVKLHAEKATTTTAIYEIASRKSIEREAAGEEGYCWSCFFCAYYKHSLTHTVCVCE